MISWNDITLQIADAHQKHREHIAAMPSWRFVCERDWERGGRGYYRIGLHWHKDLNAAAGEYIYLRWFTLRLFFGFALWIDRQ